MWETPPEEWRRIKNFQGWQISTYGHIKNPAGDILEYEWDEHTGIPFARVIQDEWSYFGPVWKLVLRNFYEGNKDGVEFDYADGDRANVALDNLVPKYMHPERGWQYIQWRVDSFGDRVIDRRLRGRRIQVVETGDIFDTVDEVAQIIDGDKSNIYSVLRGRLSTTKGYHLRYVEQ